MVMEIDPENKAEFRITKEDGLTLIDGIKGGSYLIRTILENREYGHAKCLTLEFERHTEEAVIPIYRDIIEVNHMQRAEEIIKDLHDLANRIELNCVTALIEPR